MIRNSKGQRSRGLIVLIGSCLLLSVGLSLLCGKLILSEVMGQEHIPLCAAGIACILSIFISLYSAKKAGRKKFIWGMLSCCGLFLLLLMGNLLFFGISFHNVALIASGTILGGFIGSITGKKKVRKYA